MTMTSKKIVNILKKLIKPYAMKKYMGEWRYSSTTEKTFDSKMW
jgi:hypothetical protein